MRRKPTYFDIPLSRDHAAGSGENPLAVAGCCSLGSGFEVWNRAESMQRGWRLRRAGQYMLERLIMTTDVSHSPISTFHGKTLGQLPVKSDSRWACAWHVPKPMSQRAHPLLMNQMRPFASKTKDKQLSHPPSKLKKTKIKAYASFKFRFRTLNSGLIRRWRAGKRHNAHSKSKKSKQRLRKPSIVPLAYAKVMKKLNFHG